MSPDVRARAAAAQDPLAAAMLPVLVHKLNNATQLIASLNSLLLIGDGEALLASRADDLAWVSSSIDELGWLLAVLASASGSNMLLERRESAGLESMVDAVRDCLRRCERDLARPARALPQLASDASDGWRVPWAIGSWLWSAGRALPPGSSLTWELAPVDARHELACQAPPNSEHERWMAALSAVLPGARCQARTNEGVSVLVLSLPEGCLCAHEEQR